jgi:hypothetical protein
MSLKRRGTYSSRKHLPYVPPLHMVKRGTGGEDRSRETKAWIPAFAGITIFSVARITH